jgi:hypothetical protein
MLLKFTTPDLLDSILVDPSTNTTQYIILTRPHFIQASEPKSDPAYDCTLDCEFTGDGRERRRTFLLNSTGTKVLAEIGWLGLQPTDIVISNERLENAKELFGCMGSLMSPKTFGVSTRFETDLYWLASADSLKLYNPDTNRSRGELHHSSFLFGSKLFASSSLFSGADYLEFEPQPLASDEEMIVTFILMEVLRRCRFANTRAHPNPISKSWLVRRAGHRLRMVGSNLRFKK